MEKPGRRSRVSSVMASFEQTIEKNKESGESSGMYLTNVASNKSTRSRTRTAGARRTFENTRLPGSNHSGHARRSNNSRQSSAKSLQLPDAGKKKDKNGPASVCGTVSTAATGSSSSSNYTNELSSSSCEDPASSSWKPFNNNNKNKNKSSSIEKDPFGARRLDEDEDEDESENSFNFDEEEWDEGSGFHAPSRGGRNKNGRSKMVMKAPPEKAGSNRSLRSNPNDDDDDGGFTVTYQNPALKTEGSESEAGSSALEHSVLCFDDQDESTFRTEANGSFNGSFSQLNNSFNQLDMNGGGGKGEATTSSGGKSSSRRDGKHHSSSSSKRRGRDSSSKHGGSSHGSGAPRSRSPKPPSSRSGGGSKPVSRGNSKRAVTAV